MDKHLTIRLPKRLIKAALVLALMAVVISPIAVSAGHQFTDVPNEQTFHDDISWLADSGVTFGCNPPANDQFCPDNPVTRGQMAAFMHRLADNQVVDAGWVGGYAADSLVRGTGTQFPTGGGPIIIIGGTAVAVDSTVGFAEVSINAPVAGALLVNGSLNLYCQGILIGCNQSDGNVYVNVDGIQYDRQYYAIDGGNSAANAAAWNSSNTAYVPVAAGDHVVKLDVNNLAGSGGATYVWSGGINVLFVPFGADGSTPAGAAPAAVDVDQAAQE